MMDHHHRRVVTHVGMNSLLCPQEHERKCRELTGSRNSQCSALIHTFSLQLQHSETSGFFKSSTLQETETGHLLKTFFYSFLLCFFLKGEIFVALHYCINQCYLSVLICIGVLEGIIITLSCIWHNIDHFANLFFKITNIFLNFCLMGIPTLFNLR